LFRPSDQFPDLRALADLRHSGSEFDDDGLEQLGTLLRSRRRPAEQDVARSIVSDGLVLWRNPAFNGRDLGPRKIDLLPVARGAARETIGDLIGRFQGPFEEAARGWRHFSPGEEQLLAPQTLEGGRKAVVWMAPARCEIKG